MYLDLMRRLLDHRRVSASAQCLLGAAALQRLQDMTGCQKDKRTGEAEAVINRTGKAGGQKTSKLDNTGSIESQAGSLAQPIDRLVPGSVEMGSALLEC